MADELRFGIYGLHRGSSANPETLARRARLAEDAGFESLWVGDHIALPVNTVDPAGQARLEAVVALTFLAAVTSRVRLAAGLIVLPQRQPVLLAKQLSTVDLLSNGRLVVGIGVGYVEPELRALGSSLAERSARTDEYLAAMLALWDEPVPSFEGRFVSFSGVVQRPRPVQLPHPPIVVGGHSRAALRRAVSVGHGWFGWDLDPDDTARALAELREVADTTERPAHLGALEITVTPKSVPDVDTARRYAELGVHRLAVQPHTMDGSAIDNMITSLGESVVGRV
jgi:probable F420-dependent oxidoreductase